MKLKNISKLLPLVLSISLMSCGDDDPATTRTINEGNAVNSVITAASSADTSTFGVDTAEALVAELGDYEKLVQRQVSTRDDYCSDTGSL